MVFYYSKVIVIIILMGIGHNNCCIDYWTDFYSFIDSDYIMVELLVQSTEVVTLVFGYMDTIIKKNFVAIVVTIVEVTQAIPVVTTTIVMVDPE